MEEAQTEIIEHVSAYQEIEKSRQVQEIQASLVIAKKFPRNEIAAESKIMRECDRFDLAKSASYAYPRAGQRVTGPTIRLAEVIARHWGNVDYGFRQLEATQAKSVFEAFCFDKETNTRAVRTFYVDHKMQLKDGRMKVLTDPREIYEIGANQSNRRVRACILQVIPGYIVDKALERSRETLKKGENAEPLSDRISRMVEAFQTKFGVSLTLIEKKLGRSAAEMTKDEFVDYWEIFNSLDQKQSKKEDWFDCKVADVSAGSEKIVKMFDQNEEPS